MKTITIIGSGMMGSALAFPARENGNTVRLVGTPLDREIIDTCRATGRHPKFVKDFPAGVEYYQIEQVEEAIEGADFIICGVSSFGVEWYAENILPILHENVPMISVTKGLMNMEDGTLITYLDFWQEKLDKLGKNMEILRMIKSAMTTDYYHISLSTDIIGVESAVALKNGYALGVALTIGLNQKAFGLDSELHYNSQAAVFGQAVREMNKLLAIQGAATLDNMVIGYGDLYVTVYGGRTRLVGILLGRGLTIQQAKEELNGVTLESLVVAERVAKAIRRKAELGKADLADFPLLMHIDDIIVGGKEVNIPWEAFTFES